MIHNRQTGITTALAKACRENDGVLVCATWDHAQIVKKQFGCRTMSLAESQDPFLTNDKELFVLYDNFALHVIEQQQEDALKALRTILSRKEKVLSNIQSALRGQ